MPHSVERSCNPSWRYGDLAGWAMQAGDVEVTRADGSHHTTKTGPWDPSR
jgi:hypothetical protein